MKNLSQTICKFISKALFIVLAPFIVFSQAPPTSYNIDIVNGQTISTCTGYFYDSGGSGGNYQNNENYTVTFQAPVEQVMRIYFDSFETQSGQDLLYIYDGANTSAPQIAGSPFSGTSGPGVIISTGREITFTFTSNSSTVKLGWFATVVCAFPPNAFCENNLLTNGGFENGLTGWTTNSGSSGTGTTYTMEGSNYGFISGGTGSLSQTVTGISANKNYQLRFYGGSHDPASYNHDVNVKFYNGNTLLAGTQTVDIEYDVDIYSDSWFYVIAFITPPNTNKIIVEAASTGDYIKLDGFCLSACSDILNPTASNNSPLPVGGTINLSATSIGINNYSWTGPNSFTSTTQNPSISPAIKANEGIYTVTVVCTNGCTATATTQVIVYDIFDMPNCISPATVTASSNSPVSSGNTINLSATTTNVIAYAWEGPNGFSSTSQNPSIANATPAKAGVYTITVTGNGLCGTTATTQVIVNCNITPSASSNSPCVGNTLNLSSSATGTNGAVSYSWNGPNGFTSTAQNPSINNVTTNDNGTYTVTITDANACSATNTTNVLINTPPQASITGTANLTCSVTSITRTATGGGSYLWSNNLGTSASVNISQSGTYTVTVTSTNGCTATATTVVSQDNAVPNAEAGADVTLTCSIISATIGSDAVIPNVNYSWSPSTGLSSTTASITNASPNVTTTYTITLTNTLTGCTATDAVIVTVDKTPPTAGVTGTANLTCSVTSVTRTATGGGSYLWSNNLGTSSSVNISQSGTYTVTVTSANGCTATATTVVSQDNAVPNAEAGADKTLNCTTSSVTIGSDAVIPNATYSWLPSTGLSSTSTSIITATPSVTTTYTLTVTNNLTGCSATDAVVVTVDKIIPTVAITGNTNLTCTTSSVTRTASGGSAYLWSNSLGTNTSVTISAAGTYTVTVTAANGCTATATTSVTTDADVPTVTISATDDTLTCNKTQATLTAMPLPSGTYTYLWSNGTTFSNITVYDAGTYSVEVTATNGCKASASIVIVEFNTVTAIVDVTQVLCKGGNTGKIKITGMDGIAPYQFKLGNGAFQSANEFTGLTLGNYAVTILDAGGCTASINVTVTEPLVALALTVTPTNLKCNAGNDGKIVATATGGTPAYTFSINAGSEQSSNTFNSLAAGAYTITAYDSHGCAVTATTTLTQPSPITVTATGSMIDCSTPKGTVTAVASGGTPTYQFAIDGTNFQPSGIFANLNGATYTITVKDANLCIGTVTAAITVGDTTKPTFIATATMATCTAGNANNDGKITIANVVNGTSYQYSEGAIFNAGSATPAIATIIPVTGILSNSLPNPSGNSAFYTIRVYNGNSCFKDVTIELLKRVCACKTDICVPYSIVKTKSKNIN